MCRKVVPQSRHAQIGSKYAFEHLKSYNLKSLHQWLTQPASRVGSVLHTQICKFIHTQFLPTWHILCTQLFGFTHPFFYTPKHSNHTKDLGVHCTPYYSKSIHFQKALSSRIPKMAFLTIHTFTMIWCTLFKLSF